MCRCPALLSSAFVDDYGESPGPGVHNVVRLDATADAAACVSIATLRSGVDTWQSVMTAEHRVPLQPNAPLFRLVLLVAGSGSGVQPAAVSTFDVLVLLHHGAADGLAGAWMCVCGHNVPLVCIVNVWRWGDACVDGWTLYRWRMCV